MVTAKLFFAVFFPEIIIIALALLFFALLLFFYFKVYLPSRSMFVLKDMFKIRDEIILYALLAGIYYSTGA